MEHKFPVLTRWATIYNGKLPGYLHIWKVKGQGKPMVKFFITLYNSLLYNEQLYNIPFSVLHFPSCMKLGQCHPQLCTLNETGDVPSPVE